MLRSSIVRAAGSSSSQSLRQGLRASQNSPAALVSCRNGQQTRQAHAISNPTLANIEKRWEAMAPQEQADLWMALRDRMKVDWNELTIQEKKAGMFQPYPWPFNDLYHVDVYLHRVAPGHRAVHATLALQYLHLQ